MQVITTVEAIESLHYLVDEIGHEPILIAGKQFNAVLLSESDWRFMQEMLRSSRQQKMDF